MTAEKNKKSVRVGIFTAIGLVFFVVGVLAIGNINKTFTKSFLVSTVFDDVNGLKLGNNIWFSGVKIGTVKEISFYGTSQVKVIMDIEFIGGGGTNIQELIDWVRDNKPEVTLIFTDGNFHIPNFNGVCTDIIWLIEGNTEWSIPYGKIIHYSI